MKYPSNSSVHILFIAGVAVVSYFLCRLSGKCGTRRNVCNTNLINKKQKNELKPEATEEESISGDTVRSAAHHLVKCI
jgi:hypothetical protein